MAQNNHGVANDLSDLHFQKTAQPTLDAPAHLERRETTGTVTISSELFEKIYLTPKNEVKHGLRQTFANPSPLGLAGFVVTLSPLTNVLMGWRGAGGGGAANMDVLLLWRLLLILSTVMEFILGNTFPMVVFGCLGSFFLTYGATLQPFYGAAAAYQPNDPATAGQNPEFAATFAFFLLYMSLLSVIFLILALRTNVVFVFLFLTLAPAFAILAASYWQLANGEPEISQRLRIAGGAVGFSHALAGWYLFTAQMCVAVDFPYQLPVGDLSHLVRGYSEKTGGDVDDGSQRSLE